jgi:hypothetical protein
MAGPLRAYERSGGVGGQDIRVYTAALPPYKTLSRLYVFPFGPYIRIAETGDQASGSYGRTLNLYEQAPARYRSASRLYAGDSPPSL